MAQLMACSLDGPMLPLQLLSVLLLLLLVPLPLPLPPLLPRLF